MTSQTPSVEVLRCPVHGIPDCSPLLNGCSIPNRIAAAYALGRAEGGTDALALAHWRKVAEQRGEELNAELARNTDLLERAMARDRRLNREADVIAQALQRVGAYPAGRARTTAAIREWAREHAENGTHLDIDPPAAGT